LAIAFIWPTFAREANTIDQEVGQQIEAVFAQFQEAYNKHDAAAMAALYTQDAVEFRSWQGLASALGANAGLRTCRRYWMLMRKFCEEGIRE
jgi:ketosteroid isomerase-like protein